jgi:aminomuconate-semialdehyde/2-hydroxymuconate-6-semialdehyde dehydrogenase
MEKLYNYIDGELQAPASNQYLDNVDPATGEVYSLIPDSDEKDVQKAYEAAEKAFPAWSKTSIKERSEIMLRISRLIDENLEGLAVAESIDNGKPISLAKKVDIPRASSNFHFFATAILHDSSLSHYMEEQPAINYTLRRPLGVVACISPWNLPLYLFTWKIAPAIASGNCVIAKPSEITPMTAFLLSQICMKAGLPKGVLNIIHGLGPKVGQALSEHEGIKAISFTGGTKTGEQIARTAAPKFKKLSLELGGKNPNIIFDDCDFDKALSTTMLSSFSNQGQICLCGSRIFIQKGIYEKFKNAMIEKTKALRIGDPQEDDSAQIGAVVSSGHMEKILSYIKLAKEEGGKVLAGGKRKIVQGRCENGFFIEPTIIEGLSVSCRTNTEEIFGPVVTLTPFETEDEVIEYANATEYGLSATIWTNDLNRAHRVAHSVQSGIIWINTWLLRDLRTPFGGMKNSGVGREGGFEALRFFTEAKNICIKL